MRFICVLVVFLSVLTAAPQAAAGSLKEANTAFTEKEYKRAFQLFMPMAEQGDSKAMVQIARMYKSGLGVEQNAPEAFRWYRSATRKGSVDGAYGQAQMLYWGQGVERDFKAAADLYRQAAEKGHAEAARVLGTMYYQGRGLAENLEQAAVWFQVGIDRGSKQAELWFKKMKRDGHLAPDGTLVNKLAVSTKNSSAEPAMSKSNNLVVSPPTASAVEVAGGVRQTITAVYPGPKPVQETKKAEDDISKPEAWAMTLTGIGFQLVAILAFIFPKAFMYGRRSFFWKDLIGERATAVMIRVISLVISILGIGFIWLGSQIIMGR